MSQSEGTKTKHVPIRTCVVTKQKLPKVEMARFVLAKDSKKIYFDKSGKVSGRGVNMVMTMDVFERAVKENVFPKAFKKKVSLSEIEELRKAFKLNLDWLDTHNKNTEKVTVRVRGEIIKL